MNKVYTVYFQESGEMPQPICTKNDYAEAEEALFQDAKERGICAPHWTHRVWGDVASEEGRTYDLGSWSGFYIIREEKAQGEPEVEYDDDLLALCGGFSSFRDLFNQVDLSNLVLRYWFGDDLPIFKVIVGYTDLGDDILLHVVDAEGTTTNTEAINIALRDFGIQLVRLSEVLKMEPTFMTQDM